MNYLFTYLKTLGEREADLLSGIDLSGRERETLDLLLRMRTEDEPTKEEACGRLKMSGSMFDKTCSILLRKAYQAVVPQEGIGLLEDLHRRSLTPNFTRELKRQEREIAGWPREERIGFYRNVFNLIHTRFSMHYNPDLARRVAAAWKRLQKDAGIRYYTDVCILGMETWRVAAGDADDRANAGLLKRLEKFDRRIDPDRYPLARYRLNLVWAVYRAQIEYDVPHRTAVLDEALELCRKHPDVLPESERIATELIRAEHEYFFGDDHRTAWRMYRDLFRTYPNEADRQGYHRMKYMQLCLITGDYETAERLLRKYGTVDLNAPDIGQAKGSALIWGKLSLYRGRFDDARRYIDLAFELNQKRFFIQYEIECRLLQTAWFALRGDDAAVEALAPAHMKYLRSKGYYLKTSAFYPWFFKLALAFIDERVTGKPLSAALERKYEAFQKGAAGQYGELLRRMREQK